LRGTRAAGEPTAKEMHALLSGLREMGFVESHKPHHRADDYVDKILRAAKPGDIPVEQPAN
jgi:hypothetical protein